MFMDFTQPGHIGEMPPVFVIRSFHVATVRHRRDTVEGVSLLEQLLKFESNVPIVFQ